MNLFIIIDIDDYDNDNADEESLNRMQRQLYFEILSTIVFLFHLLFLVCLFHAPKRSGNDNWPNDSSNIKILNHTRTDYYRNTANSFMLQVSI